MKPLQFGGVHLLTQSQAKQPGYFDLGPEHPEVTHKFDAFVAEYRKKQGASVPVQVYYLRANKRLLVDGHDVELLKKDTEALKAILPSRNFLDKVLDCFGLLVYLSPETITQIKYQVKAVAQGKKIDLDAPKA
ncbi:MAG: hypothetical protein K2X66_15485 [Cyanobacteria bacterium]|nr:hypothetical protein [Cyanobacteriota bacterium]